MSTETNVGLAYRKAKEEKIYEIAEDVVKYQNFKFGIAVSKIRNKTLTTSSKNNYTNCGRKYIKDGTKVKRHCRSTPN